MKFLHTADWHLGKTLKGRNRLEEQAEVMDEIVTIAVREDVDAVLVAGDLYENAAPSSAAQRLLVRTLRRLADADVEVIAIAGNHDHGATLEAYRPWSSMAGVHVFGRVRQADRGGVHSFTAKSTGESVNVAVLPFLSQRYAVRAAEIMANSPSENVGGYDQHVRGIIANLAGGFTDDAVNVVMAHLTCTGGTLGGGERSAQTIFEYHVPAATFPQQAHYVALGHLHRRQEIPAPCPVHYSGAPFPVDFGEQENEHVVVLVEAAPGRPATVTDIPLTAGRRLRTVHGTVADLVAGKDDYGTDYLRLIVEEAGYPGMRDEILEALPNALEIRIDAVFAPVGGRRPASATSQNKSLEDLFDDYCTSQNIKDDRVKTMFRRLHDEVTTSRS